MKTSNQQPALGTSLNRSHSLTSGLVGCWLMNEGGGQKLFDCTGVNLGTGSNNPVLQQSQIGGSCLFTSASSQKFTLAAKAPLNITGQITIWVRMKMATQNTETVIFGGYSGTTPFPGYGFGIGVNAGAQLHKLAFYDSTSWKNGTSTSVDDGTWKNVAAAFDGTNINFYISGVLDRAVAGNAATSYSGQRDIGASELGNFYNGSLSTLLIYNRCLSQTEIRQLEVNPYQMFQSPRIRSVVKK